MYIELFIVSSLLCGLCLVSHSFGEMLTSDLSVLVRRRVTCIWYIWCQSQCQV